jgi:hypothetical protein
VLISRRLKSALVPSTAAFSSDRNEMAQGSRPPDDFGAVASRRIVL